MQENVRQNIGPVTHYFVVMLSFRRFRNVNGKTPINIVSTVRVPAITHTCMHTCQPETTKKTEIFGLRYFITPMVPQGLDNLVVNHIIS